MNVGRPSGSNRTATDTISSASAATGYPELDCPWFDPSWQLDHPEFPFGPAVIEKADEDEDDCQW